MSDQDEEWVTLSHHIAVVDAELEKAHLSAAGIEAQVVGAPIAGVLPMHAMAVELRVVVRKADLAEARELLGRTEADESEDDDEDDEEDAAEAPAAAKPAALSKEDEGDASMRRAAGAAVFGFLVCPPLAMYGIYILLGDGFGPMGDRGRRLRVVALIFSTLAVVIWGYLLIWQALG